MTRAQATPWRPIDTAPMDGTRILAWHHSRAEIVRWFTDRQFAAWIDDEGLVCPGIEGWMPLPGKPHG